MLGDIFYWVFNMSLVASLVGLVILVLRTIQPIPRRAIAWIWLALPIRLLIPIGISGRYSLMAWLSHIRMRTVTPPMLEGSILQDITTMTNFAMLAKDYSPIVYTQDIFQDVFFWAGVIWLSVAILLIAAIVTVYVLTALECRRAEFYADGVYLSHSIHSPIVFGLVKPRIVLPHTVRACDLTYILLHEKAHIRRCDNWIRLAAILITAFHWFNPLCWYFLKLMLADRELACDETVAAKLTSEERKAYARALVETETASHKLASSFGNTGLKARISRILTYSKLSICSIAASILLVLTMAYFLLTNAP